MKRKVEQLLGLFAKKKQKQESSSSSGNIQEINQLKFASQDEKIIGTLNDSKIVLNIFKFLDLNEILFNICLTCSKQQKNSIGGDEGRTTSMDIKPLYLVCKSWFQIVQSEEFARNYMLIYHNLVNHKKITLFHLNEMDLSESLQKEKAESVYRYTRLNLIQDADEDSKKQSISNHDFYKRLMMFRARMILYNSNQYLEYLTKKIGAITDRNKAIAKRNVKDWTEPFDDLNEFIEMISQNSHNTHASMSFASNLYTQFLNLGYAGTSENPIEDPEVQQIFKYLRKWKLSCMIIQSSREILEMKFSNSLFCTFENDHLREYVLFRDNGEPVKLTSNNEGIMLNEVPLLRVVEDRQEGEDMFCLNKSFPYSEFMGYSPNQEEKEFILSIFTFFATNDLVSSSASNSEDETEE